ncbi:hypothetical protein T265_07651 [Opisthorchis viverrini]|uniref:Uncharacterized protein n=1 Tax=Opisthorchis viverrini TaxID=6198 RepID=A0A074ZBU1_OPIVI|nr:hypothetical protein T265_07651 [Opisthorchis viverrini]KER24766.1 hypothetical protein T265_07651 [Opisthorchis viverrini]
MPHEGGTRAGILSRCPSLGRGSREVEFGCSTLPASNCHATRRKHEGWDTARLPKPRQVGFELRHINGLRIKLYLPSKGVPVCCLGDTHKPPLSCRQDGPEDNTRLTTAKYTGVWLLSCSV